ncbi:MAG: BON domain-containing protein [Pyrinomonadaceae bacterium]
MAYDEEQRRRSRVVVETPAARREVVETQVERVPDRRGMSTGAVAALVVGAVALVTILFLFLMNRQQTVDNTNVRVMTAPTPVPQTTIIQQPAPVQPAPVVIQQPPATTTTTTQPIIVPSQSTTTTTTSDTASANGTDDSTVQMNVDKRISEDTGLGPLGIIATVANGRVTLTGSVDSTEQKRNAESVVRRVKGVKGVDNRITVSGGTEPSTSPE